MFVYLNDCTNYKTNNKSMKIGDIDIINSIVNLENDMIVVKEVLNYILIHNTNLNLPSQKDIETFKGKAIETLNKKYPNMGIKKK